jgi:hypothetical protein
LVFGKDRASNMNSKASFTHTGRCAATSSRQKPNARFFPIAP